MRQTSSQTLTATEPASDRSSTGNGRPPSSRRSPALGRSAHPPNPVQGKSQQNGEHEADLQPFDSAILAVRWATTIASIALAADSFVANDLAVIPWVALIVMISAVRTVTPLRNLANHKTFMLLLAELGLQLFAVVATGHWQSPLVFSLAGTITIASFARGFSFGLQIGGAAAIAITVGGFGPTWGSPDTELAFQWTIFLLLVAAVTAYGRHLSWESTEQYSATMEQVSELTEANALLFNLHRVAQTLPASLDLEETLESTQTRLRGLIEFDVAAVLLLDETDGSWMVAKRQAVKLPNSIPTEQLPLAAIQAIELRRSQHAPALHSNGGGFAESSVSGLYSPLMARGSLVGLLALESRTDSFDQRDLDVLKALAEPVALAIDNARWFRRLRTVGANEERTRIARDLHDRIGQSLAYLAFEVDRIVHRDEKREPVTEALVGLRGDLRTVIGEVRDTLYDLRSDVAAEKDFAATVEEFASRVAERSDLLISLDCDRGARLPIRQEREMWRIAQEALINVERHADARNVTVTWTCDGSSAVLTISDNGRGFPDGHKGRVDSYGILGMRERASSIGASLELISHPGEGTTVRCCLEQD